ncbi:MAG: hypothetical protein EOO64_00650 [Massilia sp.]|nr:MAG: hypothetical protein EOO64_00650 [Massilia sp.]
MKIHIKITEALLARVRADLHRRHVFAFERVGFLTAGATRSPEGDILLLCRSYHPVADDDYEASSTVGAQIGSDAMRKAIEVAHPGKSALLHIHTHGGRGVPTFSKTDLVSGAQFVPGFFNALPRTPHGLLVLSNTSATGLVWTAKNAKPHRVDGFTQVGRAVQKFGDHYEQA